MVVVTISVDDTKPGGLDVEVGIMGKKGDGSAPNPVELVRYIHIAEGRMLGMLSMIPMIPQGVMDAVHDREGGGTSPVQDQKQEYGGTGGDLGDQGGRSSEH